MARPHLSTGTLWVVSTPLGHDDDLSVRAVRTLHEASLIVAEHPSETHALLNRYGIGTPIASYDADEAKLRVLVERLRGGESLALVCDGGMPAICDPGRRLIDRAHGAGVPVRPVGGGSAAISAAACSGLRTDSFVFLGVITDQRQERTFLDVIGSAAHPIVALVSAPRLKRVLFGIAARCPARTVLVAADMTRANEWIGRGTAADLVKAVARRRFRDVTVVVDRRISRRRASE